jgi:uncharacterized membrane protein
MNSQNTDARLHRKSAVFAIVAVMASVGGNFLLSRGMHEVGRTVSAAPLDYLSTLLNPSVAGGVTLLAVWLLAQLSLLSWADLSYVLPITATAYAMTAVVGWLAFDESVSPGRWTGVALITTGAMLVGWTQPRTTKPEDEQQQK